MAESRITRRAFLAGAGGIVAASSLGFPAIARSQAREMVIGGAASHKAFMEPTVIPMFEKTHGCKIVFEGTKSLVNLVWIGALLALLGAFLAGIRRAREVPAREGRAAGPA